MAKKKKSKAKTPKAPAPLAGKAPPQTTAGYVIVDKLIGGAAQMVALCFRLNGHGGLEFNEQADFYQKGEFGQFVLERLRGRYANLLALVGNQSSAAKVGDVQKIVDAAADTLAKIHASDRPQTKAIRDASLETAGALNALDDLYDLAV